MSRKFVACLIFCNWKKLEPIFIEAHSMLKVLTSKYMHNFPSHPSCDLALPGNTRTTEYACCTPGMHKTGTAFRSSYNNL